MQFLMWVAVVAALTAFATAMDLKKHPKLVWSLRLMIALCVWQALWMYLKAPAFTTMLTVPHVGGALIGIGIGMMIGKVHRGLHAR